MGSRWMGAAGALASAAALLVGCGGVQEAEGELAEVEQGVTATATFGAVADARVEAAAPTTNFGSSRTLMADLSPESQSLLRFSVAGVSGTVTRATLRLYVTDGTSDGPRLFLTAGGWSETGVTWNTRPAPAGAALGDKGEVSNGTWMEYDVTSAVRGNGEVNFALVATSSNGTDVASRQADSASQRPQLVVTSDSGTTTPPPPSTSPSCGETLTQELAVATADATIEKDQPTTNFGRLDYLASDFSPQSEVWLGFRVGPRPAQGAGNIVKATLRLYAYDGSSDGPALYGAQPFDESTITWASAWPGQRTVSPIDNKAAVAANTWVEYDVTKALVVPGADPSGQEVAFALASGSSDATRFYSRERSNSALRPQLVITRSTGCTYRGTGGALLGVRQYGSDAAEQVVDSATDRQGAIAVVGSGSSGYSFGGPVVAGSSDFVLARYDASGAHLWTRGYHVPSQTESVSPVALTVTSEGNLLVVGSYTGAPDLGVGALPPSSGLAMFIAKFAPDGRPVWSRGFLARADLASGTEARPLLARDVATDASGSLIVLAESYGTTNLGGGDVEGGRVSTESTPGLLLAKFRWDGAFLWNTSVPPGSCLTGVVGRALATDSVGNVVVGGVTCQTSELQGSGPETPFVMRYSPEGSRQWVRRITDVFGSVLDVAVGASDAVHFVGYFKGRFTFAGRVVSNSNPDEGYFGRDELMVGTYRADGSEAWVRDVPDGSRDSYAHRVAADAAGRLVVSGSQSGEDLGGGTLAPGGFLARYSASGTHLWSRTLSDGPLVSVQPSGNVVATDGIYGPWRVDGREFTPRGNSDLLLLQFAP